MWHHSRPMHCVVVPRSQSSITGSLFPSGSAHCYVLPLGCWDDVYVCNNPHFIHTFCSPLLISLFRYSFAVLLSGCRSVMRAGAMWFIKDPQDQNSHPIRDILDRPTLTQLRKICVSGVMYACVVACVVGSVAGLLLLGSKSIMPFRWKNRSEYLAVSSNLWS